MISNSLKNLFRLLLINFYLEILSINALPNRTSSYSEFNNRKQLRNDAHFEVNQMKNFLFYKSNVIYERSCTCEMEINCYCCEPVVMLFTKSIGQLCGNFMYKKEGLNINITLDGKTIRTMSTTNYRPLKICALIPKSLFSITCLNILELNKFPRSITACPRMEIATKNQNWKINYTCISISTELPAVSNALIANKIPVNSNAVKLRNVTSSQTIPVQSISSPILKFSYVTESPEIINLSISDDSATEDFQSSDVFSTTVLHELISVDLISKLSKPPSQLLTKPNARSSSVFSIPFKTSVIVRNLSNTSNSLPFFPNSSATVTTETISTNTIPMTTHYFPTITPSLSDFDDLVINSSSPFTSEYTETTPETTENLVDIINISMPTIMDIFEIINITMPETEEHSSTFDTFQPLTVTSTSMLSSQSESLEDDNITTPEQLFIDDDTELIYEDMLSY